MKPINKEQAYELFRCESVLFGSHDGVPNYRVAKLFGADAVEFAVRLYPDSSNGYGIGDYTLTYITLQGFLAAVSFNNIRQIREAEAAQS